MVRKELVEIRRRRYSFQLFYVFAEKDLIAEQCGMPVRKSMRAILINEFIICRKFVNREGRETFISNRFKKRGYRIIIIFDIAPIDTMLTTDKINNCVKPGQEGNIKGFINRDLPASH